MHNYCLCGWRVRSQLPLPDVLPWMGEDRPPDLIIRFGEVPPQLQNILFDRPQIKIARNGGCLFTVPDVATYFVEPDGLNVVVAPFSSAQGEEVGTFLLGTIFAVICFKRGVVPLHASCVRLGAVAVAFCGASGIGKSTLAAVFSQRGIPVLSDDTVVIALDPSGRPAVLPMFPRLKLWADILAALDLPVHGLTRTRAELGKFHVPVEGHFSPEPVSLVAVYHLNVVRDVRHEERRRLHGMEAVKALYKDVYRVSIMPSLVGGPIKAVAALTRVAAGIQEHWNLSYQHTLHHLDPLVDLLIQRHVLSE